MNYLVTYVEYYHIEAGNPDEALEFARSEGNFIDRDIYVDEEKMKEE